MLFNPKYNNIELKDKNINLIYKNVFEKINNYMNFVKFSIEDTISKKVIHKFYIHSKINESSKELTEHFNKDRFLNIECAIEIEPKKREIIVNKDSPCLFCSLPLIGSESHILPFILNSNDFETSTEREAIILCGDEFIKDKKRNDKEIISDVGINRFILKRSYELFNRVVNFLVIINLMIYIY